MPVSPLAPRTVRRPIDLPGSTLHPLTVNIDQQRPELENNSGATLAGLGSADGMRIPGRRDDRFQTRVEIRTASAERCSAFSAGRTGAVGARDDLPPHLGVRVAEVDAAPAIMMVDPTRL